MSKNWKETEFYKKLKQIRVNRAVYLSAVIILLSLAVILAVTAVANRARRARVDEIPGGTTTESAPVTEKPVTEAPVTEKPEPHTDVAETIPELALPVSGKLTQGHSVDVQVFSQTMKDYRVHLGIDIATAEGAPVCAAADGVVSQIWEDPMMGRCVALSHSADCVTVYKNLAKDLAEGLNIGTSVQRGQLLGYVGDTALLEIAEDPHLHMEMTVGGLQVNPIDYFSTAVVKTLTEDDVYEDGK